MFCSVTEVYVKQHNIDGSLTWRTAEQRLMKCKCQEEIFKPDLSFWNTAVTVINTIHQARAIALAQTRALWDWHQRENKAMVTGDEKALGIHFLLPCKCSVPIFAGTVLEIGLNSSQILTATTRTDINDLRFRVVEIQPTYFSWEERYGMKLQDGRNIC